MAKKAKYTIEQLKIAVKKSTSIRQVLYKLDLRETGGNYSFIQLKIRRLRISTKHFTGQLWNKGKTNELLLQQQLTKNSTARAQNLKTKLLRTHMKDHRCEICDRTKWNGVIIPIELHHVNGDKTDNRQQNIQLLCPNCHAQTDNYRGRKRVETIQEPPVTR
jgi:hypothetical protein